MICKKCKAEIPEGSPFCVNCGTEVDSEVSAAPVQPQQRTVVPPATQRTVQPQQRQTSVQPQQTRVPPQAQRQTRPEPSKQPKAPQAQMPLSAPQTRPSKPFSKQPETTEKPIYLPKDKNAKKVKFLTLLVILLSVIVVILGVKLSACQHVFLAATCDRPQTCEICGETRGEIAGHKVEKWEVIKNATCNENGEEKGFCTVCGKEVTTEIEKNENHVAGKWETVLSSNENGYPKKVLRCINCGITIDEQEVEGEAVGVTEITGTTETTKAPETTETTESTTETATENTQTNTVTDESENTTTESVSERVSEGAEPSDTETTEETTSQKY